MKRVVAEFNALGFQEVMAGLVDKDDAEEIGLANVFQLDRYSIENYLLDPIYFYACLLHQNRALDARTAEDVEVGRESELRGWDDVELQKIADVVIEGLQQELQPEPTEAECEMVEVRYTNGAKIQVPRWLIARRGKTLLGAAERFARPCFFSTGELATAMQRVGLIPDGLRKTLASAVGM